MGGKRTLVFAAAAWHPPGLNAGGTEMKAGTALLAAGCLAILGCTERQATDNAKASDAVKAADASFQQAIAAKDLNKIISFYADDAVLMPAAKPLLTGKAAITDEWKELLAIPAFENTSKLAQVEVSGANDLAYTRGSYETRLMGEDGKIVTEPGKWLSVWRKQPDGSWRVAIESYNTDIPPPDHQ
jgi:ketosteroid isomerase-like protein